jgi:outer membrane protein assembly factor BamE (lipoprotein component of BamABCDE complex)
MLKNSARFTSRRRFLTLMTASVVVGFTAACTPTIDHRGYLPRAGDLQKITPGMSKTEVEAILGSPSTTATINSTGDSYYYISSKVETQGFFDPKETERKIFAVRFDQLDQVQSFAQYGLEDGQIIDLNSRKTPTRGREYTILQQLFGNIGASLPGKP